MLQTEGTALQGPGDAPRLRPLAEFQGSLGVRTYLSLRAAILELDLPPGAPLRKPAICAVLGVSRSPVAEAVARLAAEGLVDVAPQAGTWVARLSMADLREGAFLREAIELAAIEAVAPAISDDTLLALHRTLRMQEVAVETGDLAAFHALDAAMHEAILAATGFRRLAQVAGTARLQVDRARRLMLPVPGRVARTVEEHRAILAALQARDAKAARAAMRHHLRQLLTLLAPLEHAHPEFFKPG